MTKFTIALLPLVLACATGEASTASLETGTKFTDTCPSGSFLVGLAGRTGAWIDAVQPVCASWDAEHRTMGAPGRRSEHGGSGGSAALAMCPPQSAVSGWESRRLIAGRAMLAEYVAPQCRTLAPPHAIVEIGRLQFGKIGSQPEGGTKAEWHGCPAGEFANGIVGRDNEPPGTSTYVGSVDFTCAPADAVIKSIGRIGQHGGRRAPAGSICDAAKAARARNSPAAANLESQCVASTTVTSIGRTDSGSAEGGAPESICDRAAEARERASPAAADLATQCENLGSEVPGLNDLMATGRAMARANPLAAEMRARQPIGPLREGFDIGVAVTGSDTAWGPGKQKVLDTLSRPRQEGFKLALSLVMDQNRHAELATIGLGIASADPSVAALRAREADPRFKLGFDIASGLFGDPALGAAGNTASGPGAFKIRDSLSAPARRGFETSMQWHLARNR